MKEYGEFIKNKIQVFKSVGFDIEREERVCKFHGEK